MQLVSNLVTQKVQHRSHKTSHWFISWARWILYSYRELYI